MNNSISITVAPESLLLLPTIFDFLEQAGISKDEILKITVSEKYNGGPLGKFIDVRGTYVKTAKDEKVTSDFVLTIFFENSTRLTGIELREKITTEKNRLTAFDARPDRTDPNRLKLKPRRKPFQTIIEVRTRRPVESKPEG